MTGSELSSTALSDVGGRKSQEVEQQQQVQQKGCDQLSESSSSPDNQKVPPDDQKVVPDDQKVSPDDQKVSPDDQKVSPDDQKVPPPASSEIKPTSSESENSHSPSPDPQTSSTGPPLSRETKVGGVPRLLTTTARRTAGFSSAGHSKMKRTVSNCNVRNTSTLCPKDSSYVYHCPGRGRTQHQKKGHPKVLDTTAAPLSSLDALSSQLQLALMEDSENDETQSMVELGSQPFRGRGVHGSSLRRADYRVNSLKTTQYSMRAMTDADHRHLGCKIPDKHPGSHGQLVEHPLQQTSHMALERVHSVSGRPTAQMPRVQQEQLLLGHRQPAPPGLHPAHPLTQHHLPHRPPVISRRGSSAVMKPHPVPNKPVAGGLARVLSSQVPQMKPSAYQLLPDSKVKLHVPSGRKMESLV